MALRDLKPRPTARHGVSRSAVVVLVGALLVSSCGGQAADLDTTAQENLVEAHGVDAAGVDAAATDGSDSGQPVDVNAADPVYDLNVIAVPPTLSDQAKVTQLATTASSGPESEVVESVTTVTTVPAASSVSTTVASPATTLAPVITVAPSTTTASTDPPAAEQNSFPDVEVVNVVSDEKLQLKTWLGEGDTPILFWFWLPN